MKKALFVLMSVLLAALISLSIYYVLNSAKPDTAERESLPVPERMQDSGDLPSDVHLHTEVKSEAEDVRSSVSHSAVSGYLMLAEGDSVNIYEVYDNGYRERIRTLDINPKFMRKNDYRILSDGISVDTYSEMCSLIEDFSS